MGADLLETLEVLAHLLVDLVRDDVSVLAVGDVLLPVEEPGGDLEEVESGRGWARRVVARDKSSVTRARRTSPGSICGHDSEIDIYLELGGVGHDGDNALKLVGVELSGTGGRGEGEGAHGGEQSGGEGRRVGRQDRERGFSPGRSHKGAGASSSCLDTTHPEVLGWEQGRLTAS